MALSHRSQVLVPVWWTHFAVQVERQIVQRGTFRRLALAKVSRPVPDGVVVKFVPSHARSDSVEAHMVKLIEKVADHMALWL